MDTTSKASCVLRPVLWLSARQGDLMGRYESDMSPEGGGRVLEEHLLLLCHL